MFTQKSGLLQTLHNTRTGVLAGESLARRFGLKAGDKIPLQTEQVRKDGSTVWTFDVVGILHVVDPNMPDYKEKLVGNWDYVDEARQADTGTVTYFSVKASNSADVDRVARAIDALTANSDHETNSTSPRLSA